MQAVRERGAVVEAVPAQPLGAPSVCLLVQPGGSVSVVATFERIFCPAHVCVGHACPQISVTPAALADAAVAIGETLARNDFMGALASPAHVRPSRGSCVCMHAHTLRPFCAWCWFLGHDSRSVGAVRRRCARVVMHGPQSGVVRHSRLHAVFARARSREALPERLCACSVVCGSCDCA